MGSLFDKESDTTTMPEIPESVMTFIEEALGRYSQWAEEGGSEMGGVTARPGITEWAVGKPGLEPGQVIRSHLKPQWWAQNTGEWRGPDGPPPSMEELQRQGLTPESARVVIQNWGQDVDPLEYFYVWDENSGQELGGYEDFKPIEGEEGDFWKEHPRPVVGPDPLELLAGDLAQGLSDLPEEYRTGLGYLQQLAGLDPNEALARDILLQSYARAGESDLPSWATALREAGAEPISLPDIVNTPIYNEMKSAFQESISPVVDSALAQAGLGLSASRGAAQGAAFAPYVQDLIGKALDTATGNRAAKMAGIEGGAGILSDDLNRVLQQAGLTSSGLMNLGQAAKDRISQIASGYFGTGEAAQRARMDEIASLMNIGGTYRDVNQQQAQSAWEDWMRRAAAYESSLGGPMGMVPSTIGATSTSDKKANKD